jgi:uncharacterized protein (TIGR02271 family)
MQQQTIVGLYPTRALAQDVQSKLQSAGIPASNINLSADPEAAGLETAHEPHHEGGFWDWLFGSDVSAEERERYSGHLRGGNVAVSVRSRSEAEHERVISLMEQFDPIDIDSDETTTPVPQTSIAGDLTGASQPVTGSSAFAAAERRAGIGSAHATATDGDQVVPIAKEELEVGKRQVEQRHRIRTHVIERPVEQEVTLRDETISVERRPATQASVGADAFKEREFEVVERDEEAVVSKQARVKEEVVIHKDVKEHVETVRDTVRETQVDIDRDGAGGVDRAAAGSKPASPTLGAAGAALPEDNRVAGETAATEARDLKKDGESAFKK